MPRRGDIRMSLGRPWPLAFAALLVCATALGRGGGGCLEQGTPVLTPDGPVAIERLGPGDSVWSVRDGRVVRGTVVGRVEACPAEFVEISLSGRTLRASPEHPIATGAGTYRIASSLKWGRSLVTVDDEAASILEVRTVAAARPAYDLIVLPFGNYFAGGVLVHNKGCFLPEAPITLADGSTRPISRVRPGDTLLSFAVSGEVVSATVSEVTVHEVDGYCVVTTERAVLRVTAGHPFYVGDGEFRTLSALKVGDRIFAYDGTALRPQLILGVTAVAERVRVYNVKTDASHTFFAWGAAVHNKGGGCFLPDAPILLADGTERPIRDVKPGDVVTAVTASGHVSQAVVREVLALEADEHCAITTDRGVIRVTADHPFYVGPGAFKSAGALRAGESLYGCDGRDLLPRRILDVTRVRERTTVYNLRTNAPHTFVAWGMAVHNKGGGGGFHGGSGGFGRHGGSASMSKDEAKFFFGFMAVVVVIFVVAFVVQARRNKENQDLDFVYGRGAVRGKAEKTRKLLEFIARTDASCAPDALRKTAELTFVLLQKCWQSRDYEPMKPLLMTDLWVLHMGQLAGLRRNHEINVIEALKVEAVDVVNVRYTNKPEEREFTALITASAVDYYVDDRTRKRLRGDTSPARFQEFWTFLWIGGKWLLREIEQSRESDALKEENFFEPFTDQGLKEVYGEIAGQSGPIGPWLEAKTANKAVRIERLLNFLAQTDPIWNRQAMVERARKIFLQTHLARESGDAAQVPSADLFPDVAESLSAGIRACREKGLSIEFRNLCVRKVELILVRNFVDRSKDEFTARIGAHAQRVVRRNGVDVGSQKYVTPFEEYWTFGRLDNQWKLKEVAPPARGRTMIEQENLDEGTSQSMLEWYYRHTRAT